MINPLDRFGIGSGGEAFARGRMIGAANSSVNTLTGAMRGALDRYYAQKDKQQGYEMQDSLNRNKAVYDRQTLGGEGGMQDFMTGVEAPAGYNVVPDYEINSATRSVMKKPRFVKAQNPIDAFIASKLPAAPADPTGGLPVGNIIPKQAAAQKNSAGGLSAQELKALTDLAAEMRAYNMSSVE